MSSLQWFGIWGMTGFSKPEKSDLDKWSKGITYLLADQKGVYYFREFLSEPARDFGRQLEILEIWEKCNRLVNQGDFMENEARVILNSTQGKLGISSAEISETEDYIRTGNEIKVQVTFKKIQDLAKDDLKAVYDKFIDYSQNLISQKKVKCTIQ